MPPKKTPKVETPEVAYPFISVWVCASPEKSGVTPEQAGLVSSVFGLKNKPITYRPPLTAEDAKELFGCVWETDDGPKFGEDYLFKDWFGKKVRATKNVRNRAVTMGNVIEYEQDMLRRKWELNGEPIIIGKTGITLDAQHQLIALIRAEQRRTAERDMDSKLSRWELEWGDTPVSIDKLIVFGIEESDKVINTINTCRSRTMADVLYRSPFFADWPAKSSDGLNRDVASRVCDHAIKQLWHRTGMYLDNFSPRRTHSEGIDWIERHGGMKGRFCRYVREVIENNRFQVTVKDDDGTEKKVFKLGKISQYVPLGYAAAMLWLMACDSTPNDGEDYYAAEERTDQELTWENWKKAVEFWAEFGKTDEKPVLGALHDALDELNADEEAGRFREKDYIICKAWLLFRDGKDVTKKGLKIDYSTPDASGKIHLINVPTIGGIDLGNSKIHKNPADGLAPDADTQAQVENGIHDLQNSTHGDVAYRSEEEKALTEMHRNHPDVTVILMKNALKNWTAWEEDARVVGSHVGKEPKKHPTTLVNLTFKPDQIEEITEKLTDEKLTVGFAEKDEKGVWAIVRTCKPSTKPVRRVK